LFLYDWDDTQSAWGPDCTKAHRFASAPTATHPTSSSTLISHGSGTDFAVLVTFDYTPVAADFHFAG